LAPTQAQAAAQSRFYTQYVTFCGEEAMAKATVVSLAMLVGAAVLIDVRSAASSTCLFLCQQARGKCVSCAQPSHQLLVPSVAAAGVDRCRNPAGSLVQLLVPVDTAPELLSAVMPAKFLTKGPMALALVGVGTQLAARYLTVNHVNHHGMLLRGFDRP
jgi:hypothetical protein